LSTTAPFLSRHLGDYLLVAQLSEDPLGTVFRALYAADERRFVRLRVLQSEELDAARVLLTVRENRLRDAALAHDAIVLRPELDVVDGIPFMTWDETAGWTLDTMLARVRAFGIRIPAEYALLIAERLAAALEHAHQAVAAGRTAEHGILWPGFVSISHDAAVRVGGFGIAGAILPSLGGPRMTAEIAPYVAPELRRGGTVTPQADVYSLGAILMELMTGRRPSLDTPSAELRAGDFRSDELGAFLRRCLAQPGERFASATEAHRALQQMVTGSPFSLFTANLALFLYKLLNPESQSVAPSSDWESTSPVVIETKTRRGESTSATSPGLESPRRRRGDLEQAEEAALERVPFSVPPAVAPPAPADFAPAPLPIQEHAAGLIEAIAPEPAVPPRVAPSGALIEFRTHPPISWRRPALAMAAAAGLTAGVLFLADRLDSDSHPAALVPAGVAAGPEAAAPFFDLSLNEPSPLAALVEAVAPGGRVEPASHRPAFSARPGKKIRPELKQPTEDLRYKAALARIEADRQNARETASDIFGEGEQSEKEGARLLRQRDYDAAQMAFSRAAQLFQTAEEVSFQERVRDTSLSANP
jgi:hypothetical protein